MSLEESKSLHEFTKVLHNTTTKKHYFAHLRRYQAYTGLDYDQLVNRDIDTIQSELEKYLEFLQNEEGHSKRYVQLAFSGIGLFYGMNNKIINKIRISKMIKPQEEIKQLHAYTNEDIIEILEAINLSKLKKHPRFSLTRLRLKTMIHFLASSGVRIGGMTSLKIKDIGYDEDSKQYLRKIEDCYSVKVYANSQEEYITFLTPHASRVLDEWLISRRTNFKRILTNEEFGDLPLFDITQYSIMTTISRLIRKTKLNYELKDKPTHHAFRYRFNTIAKNNKDVNPILVERLLGHTTSIALDRHYLKPTIPQLYTEYKKIIREIEIH